MMEKLDLGLGRPGGPYDALRGVGGGASTVVNKPGDRPWA